MKERDLEKELREKVQKLDELVKARSKAYCSSVHSTAEDVRRETEIEILEEEIHKIEEELQKKKVK